MPNANEYPYLDPHRENRSYPPHEHLARPVPNLVCISRKQHVKELCKHHGFPDMSSKITVAVEGFNNRVMPVRLGVVYRAMRKEHIPTFEGTVSIYVSKGKSRIGTQVSPFTLCIDTNIDTGTDNGQADGIPLPRGVALELFWQAAKLSTVEVVNGRPTAAYYRRRAAIYAKGVVKRRYVAKGQPIAGAIFGNDVTIVSYIASRSTYCDAYTNAVVHTPAYALLRGLVNIGVRLLLLGPDAHCLRMGESWKYAYNDAEKPFGHERVLSVLLSSSTVDKWPWEK
jgi:hypothetical protein